MYSSLYAVIRRSRTTLFVSKSYSVVGHNVVSRPILLILIRIVGIAVGIPTKQIGNPVRGFPIHSNIINFYHNLTQATTEGQFLERGQDRTSQFYLFRFQDILAAWRFLYFRSFGF